MAPEKEGGRTRRKAGAGQGAGERIGRAAEKAAGQPRDVAMVDVDPWGFFFEGFWEQAGGEDAGRPEPAEGVRTPGAKPARRGRPPRAS
jgi:hypothetical protein